MVKLLGPIEKVTRRLCGAEYPTLNLVHPYMELLKKGFAPKNDETVDTYINLIYGERYEVDDDEMDDNIPTAGVRQHWQHAHRQFRQRMRDTYAKRQEVHEQNRIQVQSNTELEDLNPNKVDYLPPVPTKGLLEKVRAAIYLSMEELWAVPTELSLVAAFLDPRFKHFNWTTKDNQNQALHLVKDLYEELKKKLRIPDDEILIIDRDQDEEDDDFFNELEGIRTNYEEEDEVTYYAREEPIGVKENPLEW